MLIGVPKEVKRDEYRVAMLPVGVEELTAAGHTVLIETGAGLGSGVVGEGPPPQPARINPTATARRKQERTIGDPPSSALSSIGHSRGLVEAGAAKDACLRAPLTG